MSAVDRIETYQSEPGGYWGYRIRYGQEWTTRLARYLTEQGAEIAANYECPSQYVTTTDCYDHPNASE